MAAQGFQLPASLVELPCQQILLGFGMGGTLAQNCSLLSEALALVMHTRESRLELAVCMLELNSQGAHLGGRRHCRGHGGGGRQGGLDVQGARG